MKKLTAGIGVLVHIFIIDLLTNVRKQRAADLISGSAKDDDVNHHLVLHKELAYAIYRHTKYLVFGIAEDAGGYQRKDYSFELLFLRQSKARPIARHKVLPLTMPSS